MRNYSKNSCMVLVLVVYMVLCAVCFGGCGRTVEEKNAETVAETELNDEAMVDMCSNALAELLSQPCYHIEISSDNSPIQTQIYCNRENYLISEYDNSLRLASAVEYDGVYAVAEQDYYSIEAEGTTSYLEYLPKTYDIQAYEKLSIKEIRCETDGTIKIDAEWEELCDGIPTFVQGQMEYKFTEAGKLSSVTVSKTRGTGDAALEPFSCTLINIPDTQQNIADEIQNAVLKIKHPDENDDSIQDTSDLDIPPSNHTEFDMNFLLGSDEMKWQFFGGGWAFALSGQDATAEGIVLTHNPLETSQEMALTQTKEYYLEAWNGEVWELLFTGNKDSDISEQTTVFAEGSSNEPVSVSVDWGTEFGALDAGKYRVGMYYTATTPAGEKDTALCYAKFQVSNADDDKMIQKCTSALQELLERDAYHIQRTDYMSEQREKENSHYYVTNIWKYGENYYSEISYFFNKNGQLKSSQRELLRNGKGYNWSSRSSQSKDLEENDYLTAENFSSWTFHLDCTNKSLEKVRQENSAIIFEFPKQGTLGGHLSIKASQLSYVFDKDDKLSQITFAYILDNQEKVEEIELLVQDTLASDIMNMISNQDVSETDS